MVKKEQPKTERIYTIPLRKAWRTPKPRRAKKAMTLIREFLERHMKTNEVKIGNSINESVWARGIQKPPRRVRIHVTKTEDVATAEMIGVDIKAPTKDDLKKKEEKEKQKREKIKKEREERKKMTMQEEIEQESGKHKKEESEETEIGAEKPKKESVKAKEEKKD